MTPASLGRRGRAPPGGGGGAPGLGRDSAVGAGLAFGAVYGGAKRPQTRHFLHGR